MNSSQLNSTTNAFKSGCWHNLNTSAPAHPERFAIFIASTKRPSNPIRPVAPKHCCAFLKTDSVIELAPFAEMIAITGISDLADFEKA
jgi:hypothetical protein